MSTRITSVVAALLVAWNLAGIARAVPITGGTGPGGVGTTDGLSNLEIWLRADAGVLNAGAADAANLEEAATWEDQSGNGFDMTAAASQRPVLMTGQFNNQPALTFTSDFFSRAAVVASGNSARSVIIVAQTNNNSNVGIFDLSDPAGGSGSRYIITPETAIRVTGNIIFDQAMSLTDPQVLTVRNGVGENITAADGFLNGDLMGTSGSSSAVLNLTGTNTLIGQHSGSAFFSGRISEIAVFDRELNDAERVVIENSLNAKYDLDSNATLTFVGDVYAGDLNANGDYDSDVFGVGREDASNQLTNGGSAGFGIEATSGIVDDGDYILAGHNVPVNGRTEDDIPAGLTDRWERVWYVDRTDANDNLDATLSFDFTDAGLSEPTIFEAEFALLYSPSEPLSFVQIPGLTTSIDGDTVSFLVPAALLADGYYTLGIFTVPEPSTAVLLLLGLVGMTAHARRRREKRQG